MLRLSGLVTDFPITDEQNGVHGYHFTINTETSPPELYRKDAKKEHASKLLC